MSLTSCDDDDEDGVNNGLVGIWASQEDIDEGHNYIFVIKLTDDGNGIEGDYDVLEEKYDWDYDETFRWSIDKDKLYIHEFGGNKDDNSTCSYRIEGNKFILYRYEDSDPEIYVRWK